MSPETAEERLNFAGCAHGQRGWAVGEPDPGCPDCAGSLDRAWREAEAALPEGWIMSLHLNEPGFEPRYEASAGEWAGRPEDDRPVNADTPAAALLALASALRSTPASETEG